MFDRLFKRWFSLKLEDLKKPVEWCIIEKSYGQAVFGGGREVRGYIPRQVLKEDLKINMSDKTVWFHVSDCEAMRKHPLWKTPEQFAEMYPDA